MNKVVFQEFEDRIEKTTKIVVYRGIHPDLFDMKRIHTCLEDREKIILLAKQAATELKLNCFVLF